MFFHKWKLKFSSSDLFLFISHRSIANDQIDWLLDISQAVKGKGHARVQHNWWDHRWQSGSLFVTSQMAVWFTICDITDGSLVHYLWHHRWQSGSLFVTSQMAVWFTICDNTDGNLVHYLWHHRLQSGSLFVTHVTLCQKSIWIKMKVNEWGRQKWKRQNSWQLVKLEKLCCYLVQAYRGKPLIDLSWLKRRNLW